MAPNRRLHYNAMWMLLFLHSQMSRACAASLCQITEASVWWFTRMLYRYTLLFWWLSKKMCFNHKYTRYVVSLAKSSRMSWSPVTGEKQPVICLVSLSSIRNLGQNAIPCVYRLVVFWGDSLAQLDHAIYSKNSYLAVANSGKYLGALRFTVNQFLAHSNWTFTCSRDCHIMTMVDNIEISDTLNGTTIRK